MDYRDYYATLGVKRNATPAEIKRAFRKLARQHHPDLKPGDKAAEAKFKEINEANEVLSDPDKRSKYDMLGANWEALSQAGAGRSGSGGGRAGADPFGPGGQFAGFGSGGGNVRYEFRSAGDGGGFSDFFRTFFGAAAGGPEASPASGGRGSRPVGGASFEDILAGLNLDGGAPDQATGRPRSAAGQVTSEADVEIGLEEAFHGTKRLLEVDGKRLEVAVPRGVETGSRIRLRGKGAEGGDLDLVTRVRPHPVFARKGADLSRDLPITLREALLGADVPVQTLKGKVLLKIPAGTQAGRTFRLTGQGMPRLKPKDGVKPTGDLLVTVRVILPTNLGDEAQAAAVTFLDLVDQPDPRATTP
ncbi:MAG TPA: J domain-containing protein [Candidatus Limnocylindrales bacterium]|nr:J domain-containing protein [Candidatus Limnocylindrales bacterium]